MRIFIGASIVCVLGFQTSCLPKKSDQAEVKYISGGSSGVCPVNYAAVKNATGMLSFCIAKFEMKHPTDPTGQNQWTGPNTTSVPDRSVPLSAPQGKPWRSIKRNDAIAACGRVNIPGYSVALISNRQWQTVARDIEATAANWRGEKVGLGEIARGHSEDDGKGVLAVSDERNPYDGTGNGPTNGWEQRRTHVLSSNDVVWDLAGNVAEWVGDNLWSLNADENEFSQRNFENLIKNREFFAPAGKIWNDKQNMGKFNSDYDQFNRERKQRNQAFSRGGCFASQSGAGVFAAHVGKFPLDHVPNEMAYDGCIGFRCVATPNR